MNLLGRIIMPKEVAGTHEERNSAKRRMIATSTPAVNIYLIKEAHMQRCRGPNLQIPEHIEICSYQQPTGVQASSARTANPEKSAYLAGLAVLLRKNIQPLRSRYAHASEPTYLLESTPRDQMIP